MLSTNKESARYRERYWRNPIPILIRNRTYKTKVRLEVLTHYGGACKCCGFADISAKVYGQSFLQMDHIDGGGREERRMRKYANIFVFLKANGFPEGYRVLCSGCNHSMPPGAKRCLLHDHKSD